MLNNGDDGAIANNAAGDAETIPATAEGTSPGSSAESGRVEVSRTDPGPGIEPLLALVEAARQTLAQGDTSGAIEQLRIAAAQHPGRIEPQELLGIALCQAGNLDSGIAVFEEVVNQHPTNPQAHYNLAAAHHQAGQILEARRQLEVALRLDPHYQRALAARQQWAEDFAQLETEPPDLPTGEEPHGGAAEDPGGSKSPALGHLAETVLDSTPGQAPGLTSPAEGQSIPPNSAEVSPETLPLPRFQPGPVLPPGETAGAEETPGTAASSESSPPHPGGSSESRIQEAGTGSPGQSTQGGEGSQLTPPGTEQARPKPSGAPDEIFEEGAGPNLWEMAVGIAIRPWNALAEDLDLYTTTYGAIGSTAALFVVAAMIWGCTLIFQPGAPTGATLSNILIAAPLSLACGFLLLLIQSAAAALSSASFTGRSFGPDFRALALRFGLVWSLTNLLTMGLAAIFAVASLPLGPILFLVAFLWCLPLNYRVLMTYYPYDSTRALLTALFSQLLANGVAVGILYAVFW